MNVNWNWEQLGFGMHKIDIDISDLQSSSKREINTDGKDWWSGASDIEIIYGIWFLNMLNFSLISIRKLSRYDKDEIWD